VLSSPISAASNFSEQLRPVYEPSRGAGQDESIGRQIAELREALPHATTAHLDLDSNSLATHFQDQVHCSALADWSFELSVETLGFEAPGDSADPETVDHTAGTSWGLWPIGSAIAFGCQVEEVDSASGERDGHLLRQAVR
jgi:hypothetical protein